MTLIEQSEHEDRPPRKVCLVLGAGATLAQAQDVRKRRHAGPLPPLDTSFFDVLIELDEKVPPALRNYAAQLLGIDPFDLGAPKPRMEDFFKDAFYDFIQERDRGGPNAKIFGQLVVAYRRAIRATTNWVSEHCESGPIPNLLAAAAVAECVDVITFNHDLLVENALAELQLSASRWCLRHGYGHFASRRQFTLTKGANGFDDPQNCRHPRPIRIYKLHGSLNWYIDSEEETPDPDALRGVRGAAQHIRITRRRQIPPSIRHQGHLSWPVLVPPIYAKEAFLRNFMAPVWTDAQNALAACQSVVFFGYSLPSLDIEAEKSFQRALAGNGHLEHIDIVNPDPATATRFAATFPRHSVRWHGNLDRFLATTPFLR